MPRSSTSNRFDRFEQFAVDVILERRWGFRAWLFRLFILAPLSGLYRLIVRWRLWFFETRLASVHALGCLVISVGNLTVGGTGKTPVVELFARELTKRGRKVAVLSRGYKSAPVRLSPNNCSTASARSISAIRRALFPTGARFCSTPRWPATSRSCSRRT